MKNFMLLAVICLAISCQKETPLSSNKVVVSNKLTQRNNPWSFAEKWYNDCENVPWCSTPPTDCTAWYTIPSSIARDNAITSFDELLIAAEEIKA